MPGTGVTVEGIEMNVLWSDPESGRSTSLFKLAPGAVVPPHEHADVEQTWVVSGTFEDHEGVALPGHYIWRPGGSRHSARSVDAAVILSMFSAPTASTPARPSTRRTERRAVDPVPP